jgi:ubiquinone/menaquinone biosynthesis C-methylase UbiE
MRNDLDFPDNSFDIVYSWEVIHHSPDTKKAANEIFRVLKPGGVAKVMLYHKYSMVGFMLWLRYAIFAGRPFTSLDGIYANYLESPGTKAYSEAEARNLFQQFENVSIKIQLSHGDLLNIARLIWPRLLLMRFFRRNGLFMLIEATKSSL